MGYEQSIRHWKNHRKDRYTQQCAPAVSVSASKTDYDITTASGVYVVTAYCAQHAADIFRKDSAEKIFCIARHQDKGAEPR